MTDKDERLRREKLRALKELRGESSVQQDSESAALPKNISPRGEVLRELRRHGGVADGGNPRQPGRGVLLRSLAEREGGGPGGNRPARGAMGRTAFANRLRNEPTAGAGGNASEQTSSEAGDGGPRAGRRGRLLNRFGEARRHREAGPAGPDARPLLELQNRVQRLTEEVEQLRTALRKQQISNQTPVAGDGDKETRARSKKPGRRALKSR